VYDLYRYIFCEDVFQMLQGRTLPLFKDSIVLVGLELGGEISTLAASDSLFREYVGKIMYLN